MFVLTSNAALVFGFICKANTWKGFTLDTFVDTLIRQQEAHARLMDDPAFPITSNIVMSVAADAGLNIPVRAAKLAV